MNKFLKLAVIPVAFLVAGTTSSCSVSPKEIALITDVGDIDDGSFNQESWEACKEYASKNHKTIDFYRPFNDSEFARTCSIKQAVAKGAKIIILPGFKFASTCMNVMGKYPKVNFLLIDSNVNDGGFPATVVPQTDNVCCVGYKCEYSGFIAGYTTSQDLLLRDWEDAKGKIDALPKTYGYGYAGGMASDGVYQFGFGFIQGICKGMADFFTDREIDPNKWPKIVIKYTYAGAFVQHDPTAFEVKSWLAKEEDNIKIVFPCGGKLYQSITEAVQHYNKHQKKFDCNAWFEGKLDRNPRTAARWIGVDSDQYIGLKQAHEKVSIYTSALKGLKTAVTKTLDFHYANEWKRIGGVHGSGEEKEGNVPGGGTMLNNKWILGLNSVFGEFNEETESEEIEKARGDFVGIPLVYDKKTKVMRGFDKYTFNQVSDLYELLTKVGGIEIYGENGEEYGSDPGYPTGMVDWGEGAFRGKYLGNYPAEKIDLLII